MAGEDGSEQAILHLNGVHARTGQYLVRPAPAADLARALAGVSPDTEREEAEKDRVRQLEDGLMKVIAGVDETKLDESGWGVVFSGQDEHAAAVAAIRAQLAPLLEHRQAQAGERFKVYESTDGVRGEPATVWLDRHGVGSGSADPAVMPFYLLMVGPPAHIPFEFQYRVDVQRAVGRLHFDDVEDYGRYAAAVVAAESDGQPASKELVLFGPRNRGDAATSLSLSRLVQPLQERLATQVGWTIDAAVEDAATTQRLAELVNARRPGLLVTASHGVGYDAGDPDQRARQGSLLCGDWPGTGTPVEPAHAFAAADVAADAPLAGRMALLFACYGGGTPATDDFAHKVDPAAPKTIAESAFVAALPQRLLAGGMLAVLAHVDRAWSYSFMSGRAGAQPQTFESTLRQLMTGVPVGVAFDDFNVRAGELAFDQADLLGKVVAGQVESYLPYAAVWTAATDARNYVVLGDPATRLTV